MKKTLLSLLVITTEETKDVEPIVLNETVEEYRLTSVTHRIIKSSLVVLNLIEL